MISRPNLGARPACTDAQVRGRRLGDLNPGRARARTALAVPSRACKRTPAAPSLRHLPRPTGLSGISGAKPLSPAAIPLVPSPCQLGRAAAPYCTAAPPRR